MNVPSTKLYPDICSERREVKSNFWRRDLKWKKEKDPPHWTVIDSRHKAMQFLRVIPV